MFESNKKTYLFKPNNWKEDGLGPVFELITKMKGKIINHLSIIIVRGH